MNIENIDRKIKSKGKDKVSTFKQETTIKFLKLTVLRKKKIHYKNIKQWKHKQENKAIS